MPLHNHLVCRRLPIIILALLLFSCGTATAQWIDHRGKEFRIAFMQTNGAADAPMLGLSIACEKLTTGTITYLNAYPPKVQNISITVPNSPIFVTVDSNEVLLPNPRATEITRRTILVQFNDEVTVQGINTQRWSSDAFLALPYDALGVHYMILAYPNTIDPTVIGTPGGRSDFPSQFAIVAMEDNTVVQINPTVSINNHLPAPFSITMMAGDVFFAQANGNAGIDLTGTEITANKKITVYGGHQRANIPWNDAVGRDHLVEQLPPVEYWGRSAIVTPHFSLQQTVPSFPIARVLAAQNGTVVTVGDSTYTLDAGAVKELVIDGPKFVTASGPILVAQYHHSAVDEKYIRLPGDTIGDPFMALVPSPEQFLDNYSFYSYGTKELFYHYANIVVPASAMFTLMLDGQALAAGFQLIEGTPYAYARIELTAGPHTMSAARPFGLMIYGYGPYNSYGCPAGMTFEPIPLSIGEDTGGGGELSVNARVMQGMMEVRMTGEDVASVELFDALGRLVRAAGDAAGAMPERVIFDVSDLPGGPYFCRVTTSGGAVKVAGVMVL
jgi:hypothetical protein